MKPLISLGSLIDTSFEHYKKHVPAILGIMLWLLVGAIPSALGILLSTEGNDLSPATWFSFGLAFLGNIFLAFVSLHVTVALILSLREQKQGKAIDPRGFLKKAFSLDLSYLWATILKSIFVAFLPLLPLVIAIVSFIFALRTENVVLVNILAVISFAAVLLALGGVLKFSLTYSFVPFFTILEGERGMKSLRASSALVRGRWLSTFWRSFIPKLLYTLVFVVVLGGLLWISSIVGIAVSQESFLLAKFFAIANFFISTLLNIFLIPLLLLNDYYLYENLRETR